jgi:hypothetical protein
MRNGTALPERKLTDPESVPKIEELAKWARGKGAGA